MRWVEVTVHESDAALKDLYEKLLVNLPTAFKYYIRIIR